MQSERMFRKKTYKEIDSLSNTFRESIQQVALRGSPDVILCINGKFVALEYKRSANAKISKLQEYKAEKISNAGGFHYFVYPENWDQVFGILKYFSNT